MPTIKSRKKLKESILLRFASTLFLTELDGDIIEIVKFFTKFTVIYKGFWVKLKAIVVFAVENKKLTFGVVLQTNFLAAIGKSRNENGKKN